MALDCHSQSGLLPRPKRHVVLGSAQRIGATQAPGGARVCPAQGPGSPSARCPCVGSTIAKCPLPMACSPTKNCAGHFISNLHFNAKCTQAKRQPTPPSLPLQLFVSRVGLSLHYSNSQCFKSR